MREGKKNQDKSSKIASDLENIAAYLYEMGELKRVARSGWWMAGVKNPESVADHSFRVAILGYVLAELEGADTFRTMAMCLFHDAHEARINDLHRVARRYLPWNGIEKEIIGEQAERLPSAVGNKLVMLLGEFNTDDSDEAKLAHDADQLECLLQACEYQSQGYADVEEWIESCRATLKSETAKQIATACLAVRPSVWWQGLKASKENKGE